MKVAWAAKTPEQKQEWFCEQKELHSSGVKRRFVDVQIHDQTFTETRDDEMNIHDFIPYDEWELRERTRYPIISVDQAVRSR